jgi:hypothetical protein
MDSPENIPKFRMAAPESAADIARRLKHEQRAVNREREFGLEQSLAPFRVGSVEYLNAVPLTRGIEDQIVFTTPARLAELLRRDELDAALVSITEVLLTDRYDILDGELTQIKRHRGRETEGRQKGSLTHGKKTPAYGVNEHEQGTENRLAAEASSALLASQPRGQKPDVGRDL